MTLTYSDNHVRIAFGGRLGTAGESWTCGLRAWEAWCTTATGADLLEACTAAIEDVANAIHTSFVSTSLHIPSACHLDWCKVNGVDTSGHQWSGLDTVRWDYATPAAGASDTQPYQIALAVTLKTAKPRGRAHSGRIFLPTGVMTISNTTGLASSVTVDGVTTIAAGMLSGINAVSSWVVDSIPVAPPQIHVMSGVAPGAKELVTGCQSGLILDTQRRRRRSLSDTGGTLVALV